MLVNREALIARDQAARRRNVRVQVDLGARIFVPADGREGRCHVVEMSSGDARVMSTLVPNVGEQIILYVDGFGRFEAEVARSEIGYFAVRFNCSEVKRDRVAEQLSFLTNRGSGDEPPMRRHERRTAKGLTHFTRPDGEVVRCEVLDLSLSGLSLKTDAKPRIGEIVVIGQMSGRVARHHETGIAVEFAGAPPQVPQNSLTLRMA